VAEPQRPAELLAVSEALDQLEQTDSTAAELVKLRYFSGLTGPQAAEVLGISPRRRSDMGLCPRLAVPKDRKGADRNTAYRAGRMKLRIILA